MVTQNAEPVDLATARKTLIPRPAGKPVNSSTVWRWIRKGLEGAERARIKLEVIYVGSRPFVTPNAIDDFSQAVTEAKLERHRRAEELATDVTEDELAAAGLR
ncbi:hypothetical protein [Fuerstiella marisgermanici]|uniref:Uncharacterized protein n=1 Tax=Fuerstiella marisgermanici TaxID=1891926 RepID=A0A1P8WKN1_9PLAN|nr:hypothetical protein [Fuerstiella marisgermanici]APZ94624.1 hypothetical protein Fuma_04257 [Fuerstiella marisgermanici]